MKNFKFKEMELNDGNKLVAFFANNKGRGSDNCTLYVIPKNVERAENCRSQEKTEWLVSTRTSSYMGNINLSKRVLSELCLKTEDLGNIIY